MSKKRRPPAETPKSLEDLPPLPMGIVDSFSASHFEDNSVDVTFNWDNNTEPYERHGLCFASITIYWDERLLLEFKERTLEVVRDNLLSSWDNNVIINEVNNMYANNANGITNIRWIKMQAISESYLYRVLEIGIAGKYWKEDVVQDGPYEDINYANIDFNDKDNARALQIQSEFKRYVADILTIFMRSLLAPPDLGVQPLMTFENKRKVYHMKRGYLTIKDHRWDYKLRSKDFHRREYWENAIENLKKDEDGEKFTVEFDLVNNRYYPLASGLEDFTRVRPLRF